MRGAAVTMLALSLLATSCGDDGPAPIQRSGATLPSTTRAPAPATTSPPAVLAGDRYVALGDSFASGPGLPPKDPFPCLRSTVNYPELTAADLELDLVDASCSGAVIEEVVDVARAGTAGPQLDELSPETDLVTITVGGNDVAFIGSVTRCSLALQGGEACTQIDELDPDDGRFDALVAELGAALGQVRGAAPEATILFVTYPRVIGDEPAACAETMPFDAGQLAAFADYGQRVHEAYLAAVEAADEAGADIEIVDAYTESADHHACAPAADRWIGGGSFADGAIAYHPTEAGMAAVADLIVEAVAGG